MRQKPPRKTGLAHLVAATTYSLAGLRRMLRESAFRQELLMGAVGIGLLAVLGKPWGSLAILALVVLLMLAVEALNTALEVVVDHLSPDWSEFARDAKDLGSFAVMCMIGATVLCFGWLALI